MARRPPSTLHPSSCLSHCTVNQPVADASPSLVFVYGTLKHGHSNHHWLRGAQAHGAAALPQLRLYDLGPFPMALQVPADAVGGAPVQGELYGVDASQLVALDRLEGVPRLYQRIPLPLADGRLVWVYVGRAHQVRWVAPIVDGCWRGSGRNHLGPRPSQPQPGHRKPVQAMLPDRGLLEPQPRT